jgi:hypothetical protein
MKLKLLFVVIIALLCFILTYKTTVENFSACGILYPPYMYDESATTSECRKADIPGVSGQYCGWIVTNKLTVSADEKAFIEYRNTNNTKETVIAPDFNISGDTSSRALHTMSSEGDRAHAGKVVCDGLHIANKLRVERVPGDVLRASFESGSTDPSHINDIASYFKGVHSLIGTQPHTATLTMGDMAITCNNASVTNNVNANEIEVKNNVQMASDQSRLQIGDHEVFSTQEAAVNIKNMAGHGIELQPEPGRAIELRNGEIAGVFDKHVTANTLAKLSNDRIKLNYGVWQKPTLGKYDHSTKTRLKCEGDCDRDYHCAPGLKCFQRDGDEPVPGCDGTGLISHDYCYDPSDASD